MYDHIQKSFNGKLITKPKIFSVDSQLGELIPRTGMSKIFIEAVTISKYKRDYFSLFLITGVISESAINKGWCVDPLVQISNFLLQDLRKFISITG